MVRRAAERGNTDAQLSLGYANYHGKGVPQNYAEAVTWFGQCAAAGNAAGQYALALAYYYGHGIAPDYVQAYMWVDLAASGSAGDDRRTYSSARETVAAKMTPRADCRSSASSNGMDTQNQLAVSLSYECQCPRDHCGSSRERFDLEIAVLRHTPGQIFPSGRQNAARGNSDFPRLLEIENVGDEAAQNLEWEMRDYYPRSAQFRTTVLAGALRH